MVARMPKLEFCKRCGAGPRGNDPADPEVVACADCGNPWPEPLRRPERYGLRLRHVPSPAGGRLHVTRTAFNVHVFIGSWWLSVPFPRHRLA